MEVTKGMAEEGDSGEGTTSDSSGVQIVEYVEVVG